jgi:hypothetical protein
VSEEAPQDPVVIAGNEDAGVVASSRRLILTWASVPCAAVVQGTFADTAADNEGQKTAAS